MADSSRTHEPSLRELTSEVSAVKELLLTKIEALAELSKHQFAALSEKTTQALASGKEAIVKAEVATEKRFEGVNEFRDTLRDQAATFITRDEVNARMASMTDKIAELREARSKFSGSVGLLIGLGVSILLLLLRNIIAP